MEKYIDVLQDVPGRTSLVQHEIHTGDATPIRLSLYRLTYKSQEVLKEEIKTLLDQVIRRLSTSPWAAPIVLVAMEDSRQRMSVDHMRLNQMNTNDPYP